MLLSFVLYAPIIMLVAFHAQSVLVLSLCLALSVSCGNQSYLHVCLFLVLVTLCFIPIVPCLVCCRLSS